MRTEDTLETKIKFRACEDWPEFHMQQRIVIQPYTAHLHFRIVECNCNTITVIVMRKSPKVINMYLKDLDWLYHWVKVGRELHRLRFSKAKVNK